MLTKTEAIAAADALMEPARVERMSKLEANAVRIPRYYQSEWLLAVAPWRQAELVREARRTSGSFWVASILATCALVFVGLAWALVEHKHLSSALVAFVPAMAGYAALVRVLLVRQRLLVLLLRESTQPQGHGT